MSTQQSEHVIYSSFVVEKYKEWANDREYSFLYRWYVPGGRGDLGGSSTGWISEEAAVNNAKRTFGMT